MMFLFLLTCLIIINGYIHQLKRNKNLLFSNSFKLRLSSDTDSSATPSTNSDVWKEQAESLITKCASKNELYVRTITWIADRIEVTLSANSLDDPNPEGPSIALIDSAHRDLYNELDISGDELGILEKYEILFASPGVGNILYRDIDFDVFQGFPIIIETTEIYKKKTEFEGTLKERTDEHVLISLKGRIVKLPRNIIKVVKLFESKYEADDEIKWKLN